MSNPEVYKLTDEGSIELNPLAVAENDLNQMPVDQAAIDAIKPPIDARTDEPQNQDLAAL
jgi:hypothetical protein